MAKHKNINKGFFREWSAEMAYVLGFFAADGSMYANPRGAYYFAFHSNDLEILEKIRFSMSSDHFIGKKQITDRVPNQGYRIQIGNKGMFNDLLELGMTPNKSKTLEFPNIPKDYLRDFVRGYFDGDGNILYAIYSRKNRKSLTHHFAIKFTSGSLVFLKGLRVELNGSAKLGNGSLYKKTRGFDLSFSTKDSKRLCAFMYDGVENELYLKRKYLVYRQAIDNTER